MGLSEKYTAIRGHLLLMNPVPILSVAYSLLMQEENQREISVNNSVTDVVALSVKNHDNQEGHTGHHTSKAGRQNNAKKSTDTFVIYEFCRMSSHTKDKCFCVHGYPPWHRLHGKPKPKPKNQIRTAHAYNVSTNSSDQVQENKSTESAGFINTKYQQLMTMIQSVFKE